MQHQLLVQKPLIRFLFLILGIRLTRQKLHRFGHTLRHNDLEILNQFFHLRGSLHWRYNQILKCIGILIANTHEKLILWYLDWSTFIGLLSLCFIYLDAQVFLFS